MNSMENMHTDSGVLRVQSKPENVEKQTKLQLFRAVTLLLHIPLHFFSVLRHNTMTYFACLIPSYCNMASKGSNNASYMYRGQRSTNI